MLDLALWASLVAAEPAPHIILSVADDLGWHNVGWHNPEFRTPTLDALRAEGVELTRHYAFMFCSPSRASLLSGRLPLHVNQNNQANEIVSRAGADTRMTLLPARLQASAARYYCVAIGKWHLGRARRRRCRTRGFDSTSATSRRRARPRARTAAASARRRPAGSSTCGATTRPRAASGEYGTWLFAREAERVIGARLGGAAAAPPAAPTTTTARPLFMYLAWQNPHMRPRCPRCTQPRDRRLQAAHDRGDGARARRGHRERRARARRRRRGARRLEHDRLCVLVGQRRVTHLGKAGNNYPLRGGKITNLRAACAPRPSSPAASSRARCARRRRRRRRPRAYSGPSIADGTPR